MGLWEMYKTGVVGRRKEEFHEPKEHLEKVILPRHESYTHDASVSEKGLLIENADSDRQRLHKTRTHLGINAIDKSIEGGLIPGSVNLIGGGPGCGKSIFCMQFLVAGIEKYNEPGIFVSFDQPEDKILNEMSQFNWKLEEKIRKKKLAILYFTPEQVEKILESGTGMLKDVIDDIGPRRMIIDSLSAFALLYDDKTEERKALARLFEIIHKLGITTLTTLERDSDDTDTRADALEFGTDSVILFYNQKKGNNRVRSLEILKMRGTNHPLTPFPFMITTKGIAVGK